MRSRMDPAVSWVADTLDYEPLHPAAAARAPPPEESGASRRFRYIRLVLRMASTVLAAAAIGATAAAMHAAIDLLVDWRNNTLQRFFHRSLLQAYAAELAISCGLVLIAASAVQALAPRAAGGGVTWVMAYLNGNSVNGLFTPLVLLVKWAGSVAIMGASLCLGVEAPMVHIGACLSSIVCRADHRLWALLGRQRWLHRLLAGSHAPLPADADGLLMSAGSALRHENREEREAVSAGAAAGIAAAFGAPIGGVLFSLEEACSVWSRTIAWRCFIACSVAVFTHAQLNPRSEEGLLSAPLRPLAPLEWARQAPLLLAVSAGGGLLGAAFNALRLAARPLRARAKHHVGRVREALLVAGATVTVIAALSACVGSCLPVPSHWKQRAWVQHACPQGQYNDLATAWQGSSVWSIRSLISLGTDQEPLTGGSPYYTPASLAALAAAYLPLFAASAALAVPGGLFMPSLIMGGSFGALAGGWLRAALPGWGIQPGLYALCSATAVLGGVFRSSISLVVLMTEATGTLAPMFGVILAVVTSNACAVLLGTEGVYESELEAEVRVNYLPQHPPRALRALVAEQVMSCPVEGLPRVVPVSQARELLRFSQHHGFPVYEPLHRDTRAGTFRSDGFILRAQLELLLAQPDAYCDAHGRYLRPPPDADVFEERLASAMAYRLAHNHASEGQLAALMTAGASKAAAGGGTGVQTPLCNSTDGGMRAPLLGAAGHSALAVPANSSSAGVSGGALWAGRRGGAGMPASAPLLAARPSPFDNQGVQPHLNLGPFLDTAPMAVRLDTPAVRVHAMFVSLSLRHLLVVNESNHACGMITRRDLAHAAGSLLRARSSAQHAAVFLDSSMERPLGGTREEEEGAAP